MVTSQQHCIECEKVVFVAPICCDTNEIRTQSAKDEKQIWMFAEHLTN